jgi:hypothetical protein
MANFSTFKLPLSENFTKGKKQKQKQTNKQTNKQQISLLICCCGLF